MGINRVLLLLNEQNLSSYNIKNEQAKLVERPYVSPLELHRSTSMLDPMILKHQRNVLWWLFVLSDNQCPLDLLVVGVSAMKIPPDTSKLKKHIALMCDRLNKGGKLDLSMSSQTGEPLVQQQQQKAVNPLEPLSEIQEEEDETGKLSILNSERLTVRLG